MGTAMKVWRADGESGFTGVAARTRWVDYVVGGGVVEASGGAIGRRRLHLQREEYARAASPPFSIHGGYNVVPHDLERVRR